MWAIFAPLSANFTIYPIKYVVNSSTHSNLNLARFKTHADVANFLFMQDCRVVDQIVIIILVLNWLLQCFRNTESSHEVKKLVFSLFNQFFRDFKYPYSLLLYDLQCNEKEFEYKQVNIVSWIWNQFAIGNFLFK